MALVVGRESELDQRHGQYAAVVACGLRCVFLEGPAGVGKTTLLDRFLGDLAAAPRREPPAGARRPAGIVRVEATQSARTHDLDLANRLIDALADGSPRRHPSGRARLGNQSLLEVDQVRQAGDA